MYGGRSAHQCADTRQLLQLLADRNRALGQNIAEKNDELPPFSLAPPIKSFTISHKEPLPRGTSQ